MIRSHGDSLSGDVINVNDRLFFLKKYRPKYNFSIPTALYFKYKRMKKRKI